MRSGLGQMVRLAKMVWNGERGITGLETAIVLIAFIVVAAVFAFAVLTTGLFSTEKAKQTALSGLESATNTLEPKGAIIAQESTITADTIDNIQFKMTNSAGADSVGLTATRTLITYSDESNFINATYTGTGNNNTTADFPKALNTVGWGHDWILGTGDNVDPGEIVRITLNVRQIGLAANTPFKIEVIPGQGAVITIERTTPLEINSFNDLN